MLDAGHEQREPGPGDVHALTSDPTHSWSSVACSAPRSSIHETNAVLAGGRVAATTNSCTRNGDKVPRRKCSQFPELIGSVAVQYLRLDTIYLKQPCIHLGKVAGTVKYGSRLNW